jgi:hypothetical protein
MKYSALLIALYLGLEHASASGTLLTDGANGLEGVDKTLQGR